MTPGSKQARSEFGLPGLEYYSLHDYLMLLVRRKWLIIWTTLLVAIVVATGAYFIPNVYRATTTILVDPSKVPDNYVASTVTSGVVDRLATLRQQVLSSSWLAKIIEEMKLYPELKGQKTPEELVEGMRKSIDIEVVATGGDRALGAFKISYRSSNPVQAAQVANRLASMFIDQNIKARQQQVSGTAEFIDLELEDAKKDLSEKEDQIRKLKSQHVEDLPESANMHIQALSSLQLDLRSEIDATARAQQQKVYFQSQMMEAPAVVNLDRGSAASELVPLQIQLAQAQSELDTMRTRYGPSHPDVIKKSQETKELERKVREAKSADGERGVPATVARHSNPVLESQISQLDEEIKTHTKRANEIKAKIAYHQAKLQQIPVIEQQMAAITRDYQTARDHYKLLMDRKFSADMSSSLETYQKGERFIPLDVAQVPVRPFSPNRPLADLLGLAAGLVLGCVLAAALEMMDSTLKVRGEITDLLQVPVIAEIPDIQTESERHRLRRRTLVSVIGSTACAIAFLGIAILSRA